MQRPSQHSTKSRKRKTAHLKNAKDKSISTMQNMTSSRRFTSRDLLSLTVVVALKRTLLKQIGDDHRHLSFWA